MPDPTPSQGAVVVRLVGVYDADGGVRGELSYFLRSRIEGSHCGLCDITHGALWERAAWRRCRSALPVPFDVFHRDDQPAAVRAASADRAPVVVAETSAGTVVLAGPEDIVACAGDPDRLVLALGRAVDRLGLRWPTPAALPAEGPS